MASSAVRTDAWHHRSDAITSMAAGIGIPVALIGGPPCASADDMAALVASGIIAWNGWHLLRPSLDGLMDARPNPVVNQKICNLANAVDGVVRVEKCILRKMGFHYYGGLHVEVNPDMTVRQAHHIAHKVKDCVRSNIAAVADVLVHIEPAQPA